MKQLMKYCVDKGECFYQLMKVYTAERPPLLNLCSLRAFNGLPVIDPCSYTLMVAHHCGCKMRFSVYTGVVQ